MFKFLFIVLKIYIIIISICYTLSKKHCPVKPCKIKETNIILNTIAARLKIISVDTFR